MWLIKIPVNMHETVARLDAFLLRSWYEYRISVDWKLVRAIDWVLISSIFSLWKQGVDDGI